jgi:hypothetical protein
LENSIKIETGLPLYKKNNKKIFFFWNIYLKITFLVTLKTSIITFNYKKKLRNKN